MKRKTQIKVIGIGGAGGNIVSRIYKSNPPKQIEVIALNADLQDLKEAKANQKLQIGRKITRGFGAGMDPKIGRMAATESKEEIKNLLGSPDIIFLLAGLGGGTGSGALPVVAKLAKETEALTLGIVTSPFYFEGEKRKQIAKRTLPILEENLDALIVVSNDKILPKEENSSLNIDSAFFLVDKIIQDIIFGILDILIRPGLINIDLADLNSILKGAKRAFFGIGHAKGENRVEEAVDMALNSPFLENSFEITPRIGILKYTR